MKKENGTEFKESVKEIKEDIPKKGSNIKNIVIFLVCVLIVVGMILYFTLKDDTHSPLDQNTTNTMPDSMSSFKYNDYYFARIDNGLWSTSMPNYTDGDGNPFVIMFHKTPFEVRDITVNGNLTSFLPSNKTYVTLQMDKAERNKYLIGATSDLVIKLASTAYFIQGQILFNPIIACEKNNVPACNMTEIVNCEDKSKKVIFFMETEDKPSITATENCIVLAGKGEDYVRLEERLLYSWYGIMK
jgi:hypothetical protein